MPGRYMCKKKSTIQSYLRILIIDLVLLTCVVQLSNKKKNLPLKLLSRVLSVILLSYLLNSWWLCYALLDKE